MNPIKFLIKRTDLPGHPFGFINAFSIFFDNRFSFRKRLEILKYRQIVNLNYALRRLLYGSDIWYRRWPEKVKWYFRYKGKNIGKKDPIWTRKEIDIVVDGKDKKPKLKIPTDEELQSLSYREISMLHSDWILWYWQFTEEEKAAFKRIYDQLVIKFHKTQTEFGYNKTD